MEDLAPQLVPIVRTATVLSFAVLAVVALMRASRMGRSGWWVAAAFAAAAVVLVGPGLQDQFDVQLPRWWDAVQVGLIVAFPYLLLRFAASFRKLPEWLEITAAAAAVAVALLTTVPALFPERTRGSTDATWIPMLIVGYWLLVSLVTVVRLWRAGRGQPTVARRRMRAMSAALAVVALTLLVPQLTDDRPTAELLADTALLVAAFTFGLGFTPPRMVRRSWRAPEEEHLQRGTVDVLRATTIEEIADALLPPTVRIVGGAGAALTDAQREVLATHGDAPDIGTALPPGDVDPRQGEVVPLGDGHGKLVVWTSPYTPFFGREEVELLRSMAAIATLALERVALLDAERGQRTAVEEAHRNAEQAREQAVSADLAKTEFLSRMSHELRTPLNAILGFGQLLEISHLEEEDQESVAHILKAGRHLLALINDVLDLSRIEAGTFTISLEPVHVGGLLTDTLPLIRPLADSRSIALTADSAECDRHVMTDRQRCRQILLNLLSNAVKYNRDGGSVHIDCQPADERTLRIAVRDTGPGIDPARHDRLFEPFQRLGAERTGVEGTGLGLALTKQLVERLNGTIGLDSEPGEGSTFWIDLPITAAPEDAVDQTPAEPRTAGRTERTLLLVEDNLANLKLVEAFLRRRPDISVIPAMQGHLALELAQKHQPDVIVLDLHLPDLSGRDVLHRLRAEPSTRQIPVIIASADASSRRIEQLHDDGVFAYLTKPLQLDTFLSSIDAALQEPPPSREGTGRGDR